MPEPSRSAPALLVFSDDWGRHPSSCQYLVRHLLPRYRTWWVNTIGMRRPRLDRDTIARAWEKLRAWLWPGQGRGPLPEGLTLLNPRMWPWLSNPRDRRLNRLLLTRQLGPVVRRASPEVIAVTTLPVVADLMDVLPVARWVYYCVDDFSQWPGLDQQAMLAMEEDLVRRADVIVAVSRPLQDRLAQWGRASSLLTHGVDLEHWQKAGQPGPCPAPLARLERPLVVCWGMIDRRLDTGFLARLAADMDRGTVVLVGPRADPDPALLTIGRVRCLPTVPYEELPDVARAADVLVMPYADLPVTREIQPLKLKEYLATGKPVVGRRLPAIEPWGHAMDVVDTAGEFSRAVRQRIAEGLPAPQAAARQCLERESWARKARRFEQLALLSEPLPETSEELPDAW
jgi:glycosyltransferase involved in cell wall biosynthesis